MSRVYIKNLINTSSIPTVNWNGAYNKLSSPGLAYKGDGAVQYLPLITKTGSFSKGSKKWTFDASAMSTIHVRYNNTEYVVPNKVIDIVQVEITAVTTSSDRIGSGSSGSYKKTVKVTYKATGNSGYAKLICMVTNSQGLANSTATSGQTQINAGSSGTVSFEITAHGGNTGATVTVMIQATSSSGNTATSFIQLSSPWSWSNSSSSGGSSES